MVGSVVAFFGAIFLFPDRGSYVIALGPLVYGAFRLVRGLAKF